MKIQKLKNEQSRKISIEVKKINKEFCVFKAKLVVIDSNGTHEYTSEGLSSLKNVRSKQKECKLPKPNKQYVLRSKDLLDLVRIYGFPFFTENTKFLNTDFNVIEAYSNIIESSQIKFDDFSEETIEDLIFIDYRSHTIRQLKGNKPINQAISFNRLGIIPFHYNNYTDIINEVIKLNRSLPVIKYGNPDFDYSGALLGSFIFSDEEFDLFLNEMKNIMKKDNYDFYFDSYYSHLAFHKLDFLGINEHLRTQEKKGEYEEENNS